MPTKPTLCAVRQLLGLVVLHLTPVVPAAAQPVADHLECYKVKDPQAKASYTADLGGLAAEPGCTIKVPATMVCVPATKTNVMPPPPGGGSTGTPNAFGCYKVRCPRGTLPTIPLNDQFGSRAVTPSAPKLLRAGGPADDGDHHHNHHHHFLLSASDGLLLRRGGLRPGRRAWLLPRR